MAVGLLHNLSEPLVADDLLVVADPLQGDIAEVLGPVLVCSDEEVSDHLPENVRDLPHLQLSSVDEVNDGD